MDSGRGFEAFSRVFQVVRTRRASLVGRSVAAVLVALAVLPGCGSQTEEMKKELSGLKLELSGIKADNAALAERVDALEIANGGLHGYKDKSGDGDPSSDASSDRPDLAVVKLSPGGGSTGASEPSGSRTVLKGTKGGVTEEEGKSDEGTGSAATDFTRAKDLFDKKNYADALSAFAGFLVRYPDHPKAPDATYYRGVCYAAKNDPRHAAEQFEAVIKMAPKSDKAPDALEAMAKAYDKLGDKASADRARKQLKTDYPKK